MAYSRGASHEAQRCHPEDQELARRHSTAPASAHSNFAIIAEKSAQARSGKFHFGGALCSLVLTKPVPQDLPQVEEVEMEATELNQLLKITQPWLDRLAEVHNLADNGPNHTSRSAADVATLDKLEKLL